MFKIVSSRLSFVILILFLLPVSTAGQHLGINFKPVMQDRVNSDILKADLTVENHPRLFIDRENLEVLSTRIGEDSIFSQRAFLHIRKTADEVLELPLLTWYLDDAALRIPSIHRFAVQLPNMVLSYWITGNQHYAQRVWQQLELMLKYPDWGANRHFLDTGIAAFIVAMAYDGLYDYFSEVQRKQIREALISKAILPAYEQIKQNAWWSTIRNNWNGICNSGIIMALLALDQNDMPEFAGDLIARAVNNIPNYTAEFEPDGQYEEGLMYWGYGLMYTQLGFEAMQRVLGGDYALSEAPGLKKTGYFPLFLSGPVASLNSGDDGIKHQVASSFFWLSRRYKDPVLARIHYNTCLQNDRFDWKDLVFYPEDLLEGQVSFDKPSDKYMGEIDLISLRENWTDPDAMFVAMFGGDNNASHGHLDAGSFYIQGLDEYWAYGNLGSDNYTYPGYFSKETFPAYRDQPGPQEIPGRWHFYRLRAEGKNCLVINPDTRPDQDPLGKAQLVEFRSGKEESFGILDLTECYSRDVSRYHRGIRLSDQRKRISIQDELSLNNESIIFWQLHTKANIRIADNGRSALLEQNGKQMLVKMYGNKKGKFEILEANYLPGQEFPLTKNTKNPGINKLVVRFENVSSLRIRFDIQPLGYKSKEKARNRFESLSEWYDK